MAARGSSYDMPEEWKEAIRKSRIGYVPSPEACRRISEAAKGRRRSQRDRDAISYGMRLSWERRRVLQEENIDKPYQDSVE